MKKGSKRKATAPADLETLQRLSASTHKEFGKAPATQTAYARYLEQGREFLAALVAERRQKKEVVDDDEPINVDVLQKAFDKPPNHLSNKALEFFLVHRCFNENCGKSTADGIHAAFCDYWDNMDGNQYSGEYHCDRETNVVRGCPARAQNVRGVLKNIKNRDGTKGAAATRQHAEAMSLDDLSRMMEWSERECPSAQCQCLDGMTKPQRALAAMHLFTRAFMSTGFTIWTRNFELCSLQYGDLTMDRIGPAPHYLPHFLLKLENRKGWQKQAGYDGPRQGYTYEIYQQDVYAIDMYTHLRHWLDFLVLLLGRPLLPNDYVFPHLSRNGNVEVFRECSHDKIQSLLDLFVQQAHISLGPGKHYTTHCFRRGGAQYRFMYAPIGERWSLSRIRWWGGWAKGEHVDTLMKYLVDSLQSYETSHSDALCPVQREAEKSFMGEHKLFEPLTVNEFRTISSSITHTIKETINAAIASIVVPGHSDPPAGQRPSRVPTANHQATAIGNVCRTQLLALPTATDPDSAMPPTSRSTPLPPLRSIFPRLGDSASEHLQLPGLHCFPASQPAAQTTTKDKAKALSPCPHPLWIIPDLPRGAKDAWRQAADQYENGIPQLNLPPLRSWDEKYYKGTMRSYNAMKISIRKTIAEEFARYNRDEAAFLAAYPDAGKGVTGLIHAIRKHNGRRRISRNGTPEERDNRAATSGHDSLPAEEVGIGTGPVRSAQLHPSRAGTGPY